MVSAIICGVGFKLGPLQCMECSVTACNFVLLNLLLLQSLLFKWSVSCACLRRVLGSKLRIAATFQQKCTKLRTTNLEVILSNTSFCKMQSEALATLSTLCKYML